MRTVIAVPFDKTGTLTTGDHQVSEAAAAGGRDPMEVLPEDEAVIELQTRVKVAMVGYGVVLASEDPRGAAAVIRLSRSSYRKTIQNLAWAAGSPSPPTP
jgi:Cu2+-exporting ATPase